MCIKLFYTAYAVTETGCHFVVVIFPHAGMPAVLKQAAKQLIPQQTSN